MTGPSGVDLARQALIAAREAAKNNNNPRKGERKRPRARAARRDGRDPLALGAAVTLMMTERGMEAPAAGGSVLAQWEDILAAAAPELAGHARAVGFDADTGRLDVTPDSSAYATQLRWSTQKLIAQVNQRVRGAAVRTLRVLPPGAGSPRPASHADVSPEPPSGATREPQPTQRPAHPGLQRARQAIAQARSKALQRAEQDQARRDWYFAGTRGSLRETEEDFSEFVAAREKEHAEAAGSDPARDNTGRSPY